MPDLHHPTTPPSSLPAIKQCACYVPDNEGSDNEFTQYGTFMHKALEDRLNGGDWPEGLSKQDKEDAQWALDYIEVHRNGPIHTEQLLELLDESFQVVTFGSGDVISGDQLFDFKTGQERDYDAQMAAYALMVMERDSLAAMTVHVLYTKTQKAHSVRLSKAQAEEIVWPIIRGQNDPRRIPAPCDYCNWCSARLECPALNDRAQAVGAGREDWALEQYHTSEIISPTQMSKALELSKQLKTWCSAVDHHARKMMGDGVEIPGWELGTRNMRSVTDLVKAWELSGIPQDDFLRCCKVGIGDLEKAYAAAKDLKLAAAKREVAQVLDEVIESKATSVLKRTKQ